MLFDGTTRTWHMWASEIANHCGVDSWLANSRIVHAQSGSSSPLSRFSKTSTVWEIFAHEPNVVRAPSGEWVMFFTGSRNGSVVHGGKVCDCTASAAGATTPGCVSGPAVQPLQTYMSYAHVPSGPWTTPVAIPQLDTSVDTNMAVVILANNSVTGFVRVADQDSDLHRVTATDWREPLSYVEHKGILPGGFDGPEDPFLWRDEEGRFHCLMHQWPMPFGTHAYSEDGREWHYAPVTTATTCSHNGRPCAYDGTVLAKDSNGTVTKLISLARERPHLLLDAHHNPLALCNGIVLPQREQGTGKPCKQAPPAPLLRAGTLQAGVELRGVGYGCDHAVTFIAPIRQEAPTNTTASD